MAGQIVNNSGSLEVEINKLISQIDEKEKELQRLKSILSDTYQKLAARVSPQLAKRPEAKRFYRWPDGHETPVGPGRPPKDATVIERH